MQIIEFLIFLTIPFGLLSFLSEKFRNKLYDLNTWLGFNFKIKKGSQDSQQILWLMKWAGILETPGALFILVYFFKVEYITVLMYTVISAVVVKFLIVSLFTDK